MSAMPQHGNTGAYVGGDWVPIEDIGRQFACVGQRTSGAAYKAQRGCQGCGACTRNCAKRRGPAEGHPKTPIEAAPGPGPVTIPYRSATCHSAVGEDGWYDIVIIGAGAVGCAVARELSKTRARVLVLEAADDVSQGASKANSGVVHAGYDAHPHTAKAYYCTRGCQAFPQLDKELHFGFSRCGSLVLAKGPEQEAVLEKLKLRGDMNGVPNVEIIRGNGNIRRLEPHVSADVTAALYAKDAGQVIPYEYVVALAENAADNGVEFNTRSEVTAINVRRAGSVVEGFDIHVKRWTPNPTGTSPHKDLLTREKHDVVSESQGQKDAGPADPSARIHAEGGAPLYHYQTSRGTAFTGTARADTVRARYVVNCGGVHADKVSAMVGDTSFTIKARYGDYLLLNKREGHRANMILFPVPDPVKGKGILVQSTLFGNLLVGPTARNVPRDEKLFAPPSDPLAIESELLTKSRNLVPEYDERLTIHSFAGLRARSSTRDWVVGPSSVCGHFLNVAGIDSPGLTASPALAVNVVKMLQAAGCAVVAQANPAFNPLRAPIVVPKSKPAKGSTDYNGKTLVFCGAPKPGVAPESAVVCYCERVTESEIVDSIRRSLPVDTTQAVRRRCRAGMGQCQGRQCEAAVAAIIARETGISIDSVGRRPWPASSLLPQRWLSPQDREALHHIAHL